MTPKPFVPLLTSMDDIIRRAREISSEGEPLKVAVAAAHDDAAVEAIVKSHAEGFGNMLLNGIPILVPHPHGHRCSECPYFSIMYNLPPSRSGGSVSTKTGSSDINLFLTQKLTPIFQ